jgi:uncharacterized repeat protein (TIGR01451 family)
VKSKENFGGGRKQVTILALVAGAFSVLAASLGAAPGMADAAVKALKPNAPGCIALKTVAEVEENYTNEKGEPATRLVAPLKVVPGREVVWTLTATNVCDKPAEHVSIDNPVPEHMVYVAGSAFGAGTDVLFSLDGHSFAPADALAVHEAAGNSRPARAEEYTAIRWSLKNALAPGAVAIARYRASVK